MSDYAANPRDLPMPLVLVCLIGIGLGVVAFIAGEPETVWPASMVDTAPQPTDGPNAYLLPRFSGVSTHVMGESPRWRGPIGGQSEGPRGRLRSSETMRRRKEYAAGTAYLGLGVVTAVAGGTSG